jgi:hypothetical protein
LKTHWATRLFGSTPVIIIKLKAVAALGSACGGALAEAARSPVLRRLAIEQRPLAFHTPGVTRDRPVVTHHAMTGNGHSQIVGRAGACDGPHRPRRPDAASNLGVRHPLANGNLLQDLPDAPLECRAAHIERQIQTDVRIFDEADDARYQRLIFAIGADEASEGTRRRSARTI